MIGKNIAYGSDHHKLVFHFVDARWRLSRNKMEERYKKLAEVEDQALLYVPTREAEEHRKQLKREGKPQFVTVNIPYSYAQMLAAHTYWSSVFLGRSPVHQFIGRHGETSNAEEAVEAIIDYQVQVGGALWPYYLWLHDVGKYGLGIIGTYWDEEVNVVAKYVERPKSFLGVNLPGTMQKVKETFEVPGYRGNRVYNVRPQDFFPDPRVPISRFQDGEFCGRYAEVGWNFIKKREQAGYYFNIDQLKKTQPSNWRRDRGSPRLTLPNTDGGLKSGTLEIANEPGSNLGYVELLEMYVELIPHEWRLGDSTRPEKWCITVGNNSVVIGAWPLGLLHNRYPFDIMEYEIEGYGLFKRSMLEMLQPMNDTLSWLFNTHFYNVRKMLNDQLIFDPSRIVAKDLQDNSAGRLIRMKPAGYGTDSRTAVSQLQVIDVTQNHLGQDSRIVMDIMARLSGVNDNIMGMLNAGGRKSATEVRSSNSYSVNRLKTNVEMMSAQGMMPHAMKLLQTTQQFYDGEQSFRIAGQLMNRAQAYARVTPEVIAGAFDFVPVDGTMPIDRQAQALVFNELLKQMQAFPQLLLEYDVNSIFGFVASLAGVKNLDQFRVKITPDEQLQQAVRAGNLVSVSQGGLNGGTQSAGNAGAAPGAA